MNVIFTCGGTGGHINPAIAVANIWKERYPDSKILFIGGRGNMEEELVPKAGYELKTFPAYGMERGKSWAALKMNVKAVRSTLYAIGQCKKLFREFKPDVIVGTGGYASFPALMAGSLMKIPTCVHESNAMPGLTTRLIADRVSKVLVCFPESAKYYRHPQKVEVVGMPVRQEFIFTKKSDARKALKLDERPLVVSAFGSQGAKAMNEQMIGFMKHEQENGYPYQHIHAVGSYGWGWMPGKIADAGIDVSASGVSIREYIYDMPTVMAAADLIISRAGAGSCNEIAASGTPCILIPSPNVTDNHQEKNARALERSGGAVMLTEKECSAQKLWQITRELLSDMQRQEAMTKALQAMVVPDSAQRVCDIMRRLIG